MLLLEAALLLAQSEVEGVGSYVDILERAGLLGGAVLLVWAFLTERIVPGGAHKRLLAEAEGRAKEWQRQADGVLDRLERAVETMKSQQSIRDSGTRRDTDYR